MLEAIQTTDYVSMSLVNIYIYLFSFSAFFTIDFLPFVFNSTKQTTEHFTVLSTIR